VPEETLEELMAAPCTYTETHHIQGNPAFGPEIKQENFAAMVPATELDDKGFALSMKAVKQLDDGRRIREFDTTRRSPMLVVNDNPEADGKVAHAKNAATTVNAAIARYEYEKLKEDDKVDGLITRMGRELATQMFGNVRPQGKDKGRRHHLRAMAFEVVDKTFKELAASKYSEAAIENMVRQCFEREKEDSLSTAPKPEMDSGFKEDQTLLRIFHAKCKEARSRLISHTEMGMIYNCMMARILESLMKARIGTVVPDQGDKYDEVDKAMRLEYLLCYTSRPKYKKQNGKNGTSRPCAQHPPVAQEGRTSRHYYTGDIDMTSFDTCQGRWKLIELEVFLKPIIEVLSETLVSPQYLKGVNDATRNRALDTTNSLVKKTGHDLVLTFMRQRFSGDRFTKAGNTLAGITYVVFSFSHKRCVKNMQNFVCALEKRRADGLNTDYHEGRFTTPSYFFKICVDVPGMTGKAAERVFHMALSQLGDDSHIMLSVGSGFSRTEFDSVMSKVVDNGAKAGVRMKFNYQMLCGNNLRASQGRVTQSTYLGYDIFWDATVYPSSPCWAICPELIRTAVGMGYAKVWNNTDDSEETMRATKRVAARKVMVKALCAARDYFPVFPYIGEQYMALARTVHEWMMVDAARQNGFAEMMQPFNPLFKDYEVTPEDKIKAHDLATDWDIKYKLEDENMFNLMMREGGLKPFEEYANKLCYKHERAHAKAVPPGCGYGPETLRAFETIHDARMSFWKVESVSN
jgi:hypothetical protein